MSIAVPFAACKATGPGEESLSDLVAGMTEISAPESTRKSLPVKASRSERVRTGGEPADCREGKDEGEEEEGTAETVRLLMLPDVSPSDVRPDRFPTSASPGLGTCTSPGGHNGRYQGRIWCGCCRSGSSSSFVPPWTPTKKKYGRAG